MVCPNCQKSDVSETADLCPRCGYELVYLRRLTKEERNNLIEKSILKGNIAELESKEKNYKRQISQLKSYIVLFAFLLPISHCLCTKESTAPTLTDAAGITLYHITQKQLHTANRMIGKLTAPLDSTFIYVVEKDDYIENLSRHFYGTVAYRDTIIKDNTIINDRRIQINDTLILRVHPTHPILNIEQLKRDKINRMNNFE